MANSWGTNPVIIDTANDDSGYTAANDVKNGGAKYSTLRYKVKKLVVRDAGSSIVKLTKCSPDTPEGDVIFETTADYSPIVDFEKEYDFGEGIMFNGINPATLDNQGGGGLLEIQIWLA